MPAAAEPLLKRGPGGQAGVMVYRDRRGNPGQRINFPVTIGLSTAKGTRVFIVSKGLRRTHR